MDEPDKTLPKVPHFTGHYCASCQWWRYGAEISFLESEECHRFHKSCREPLKILVGHYTAKGMQNALETVISG